MNFTREEQMLITKALHLAIAHANDDETLSYHNIIKKMTENESPREDGFRYDYDDNSSR